MQTGTGPEVAGATYDPAGDYGHLGAASKLVLVGMMITGRLELYAILSLLLPRFWHSE